MVAYHKVRPIQLVELFLKDLNLFGLMKVLFQRDHRVSEIYSAIFNQDEAQSK